MPLSEYPVESDFITGVIALNSITEEALKKDAGLSLTEAHVMFALMGGELLRVAELAETTGLSESRLEGVTAKLVVKGLVMKRDAYKDRRMTLLNLSEKGSTVASGCVDIVVAANAAALSCTTDEVLELLRIRPRWYPVEHDSPTALDVAKLIHAHALTDVLINRILSNVSRAFDISSLGYRILLALYEAGTKVSQTDLADKLLAKPSNIATTIKTLLLQERVTKRRDLVDRRKAHIDLTATGFATLKEATKPLDEALMSLEGSDNPNIRKAYCRLFSNCVEHLRASG